MKKILPDKMQFNNLLAKFDKQRALQKARDMGRMASEEDVDQVKSKLDVYIKGPMKTVGDKIKKLWKFYLSPETPLWMKVEIIGALLYVISPIDLIPDTIPVIGFLDDIFVIGAIFHNLVNAGLMIVEKETLPVILDFGEQEINERLNKSLKITIRNALITLLVITAGMLLVIFKPISESISYYGASGLFLFCLIWSTIRMIRNIKITYPIAICVLKEKNLENGICRYVMDCYPKVRKALETVKKLSPYIPALKKFPELRDIVRHYIDVFKKRIFIFAGSFGAYTFLFFISKNILINQFGGISLKAAYFYPLFHIWKTVTGLLGW